MTPRTLAAATLCLSLLFTVTRAEDRDAAPAPRLRTVDARLRALVAAGAAQSPSLRALLQRLDRSDVVVYLRCGRLPPQRDGQLTFVSSAGGVRYVLVQIAWELSGQRTLATLGHELQHAVEIAERPAIVDDASLAREYARIGFTRRKAANVAAAYDTAAAIDAGARIWRELAGGRSTGD